MPGLRAISTSDIQQIDGKVFCVELDPPRSLCPEKSYDCYPSWEIDSARCFLERSFHQCTDVSHAAGHSGANDFFPAKLEKWGMGHRNMKDLQKHCISSFEVTIEYR
jgi:hypothetical protein